MADNNHTSTSKFKLFHRKKNPDNKTKSPLDNSIAKLAAESIITVATSVVGVETVVCKSFERSKSIESNHENDQNDAVMKHVEDNIIGKDLVYDGPFGKRKVVYCDYTASGKAIKFIENYIRTDVLPYYGNTHTTTTISSKQTTRLRSEAKEIIRKCTNATDDDAVIFVSSGTTGAISKLIHALELKDSPIVFISPFEHHSNLLPWLEIGAEIIYGEENSLGMFDIATLENKLKKYSKTGRPLIGSFTAASNITGILNDTEEIASLMHRYHGYAFFDYATAGPYVELNMNPYLTDSTKDPMCHKDAIFCSIHKFVGGPGTPGLLIAKKDVFINPIPGDVGGGTVLFVTHKKHHYVKDIEEREEGGTPAIVESIRAGLVFQLKQEVSTDRIMTQEHLLVDMAYKKWEPVPNLHILGKSSAKRLPIFSLAFEHPTMKRFLHYNFISSLLNDLFGIQARGGCACAGPYAEDLLGIDNDNAASIADALLGDYSLWSTKFNIDEVQGKTYSILKPGFVRLNLPYFLSMEGINYILDAIVFVAKHGWKFLPMYEMNPLTGEFSHKNPKVLENASHLTDIKFPLKPDYHQSSQNETLSDNTALTFKEVLTAAEEELRRYTKAMKKENLLPPDQFLPPFLDLAMRWFLTPSEVHAMLKGKLISLPHDYLPLFYPRKTIIVAPSDGQKRKVTLTRIKSELRNVQFCNCPVKKRRHQMTTMCERYATPINDNHDTSITEDASKTRIDENDDSKNNNNNYKNGRDVTTDIATTNVV